MEEGVKELTQKCNLAEGQSRMGWITLRETAVAKIIGKGENVAN